MRMVRRQAERAAGCRREAGREAGEEGAVEMEEYFRPR